MSAKKEGSGKSIFLKDSKEVNIVELGRDDISVSLSTG